MLILGLHVGVALGILYLLTQAPLKRCLSLSTQKNHFTLRLMGVKILSPLTSTESILSCSHDET